MKYLIVYFATAIVFFGLDYLWLTRIANNFYKSEIGALLLPQPNLVAAGVFYIFYIAGIVYFAVMPNLASGNWAMALLSGALLGLLAYGTYDMTNYATLKGWTMNVVIVDMAWGMFLTGTSAALGLLLARKFIS